MKINFLRKFIVHIQEKFLGEEELCITISPDLSDSYSTIVKTGYGAGYRLVIDQDKVTIKRVDRLAVMAGFPPMYYFRGILWVEDKERVLRGCIRMALFPRWFILIWSVLISLALIVSVFAYILLLWRYWSSSGDVIEKRMMAVSFFVGMIVTVGGSGAVIIGVIRWLSSKQRYQLKKFCFEYMEGRVKDSK
ncbi:hypothetical protein [Nitrosomonas sp.]|uniref:hypothetical protein n=1 Tax=Nitrosomonas sp. TaxID=42353 RepID=UPI002620F21E|nr:hypothetical protein [Nitrosomonas sp.]